MIPETVGEMLKSLKEVDWVIGIPSYNNADTIGYVVEVAAEGITEFLGGKGIIVNSDGGSTDGTRDVFMNTETHGVENISFVYEGIPGKGSAMASIMEVADILNARGIVFLDADLRSVRPWWIERLSGPISNGSADYVTPYYIRHKYDATITNHICYPLTSVLYGKKIRQPIGGDFGVSKKMYRIFLDKWKDFSESDVARFGIDIWMTTISVNEGRVHQAFLGAKIHDVKDPGKHLSPMFVQVVGTLFELAVVYRENWKRIREIEEVPVYGERFEVELEDMSIDIENLKNKAREGVLKEKEFLENLVKEKTMERLLNDGTLDPEEWVEIVYSFMLEYRKSRDPKLVEKMIPLYFARIAGFAEQTADLDSEEAEKVVEEQLSMFSKSKGNLVERW